MSAISLKRSLSVILLLFVNLLLTSNLMASEPVWDANKVNLITKEIETGVYAFFADNAQELEEKGLPAATSGGFIVGDKGVLMIDTMLNKRLNLQVQQLIKAATDKPIMYAVNTSYHGDHSYGNMYLPAATKIIQHLVTQQYIQTHFSKDTEFMMQNFGSGRGIEDIKPVPADILLANNSKTIVDLGGRSVEIIDFGFAQTGGDLFVWEPVSKTLWTGNPIITIKPSLPWLLDGHLLETLDTLTRVYNFLPDDAHIVPGHGSVMTKEDLRWHLDYLNAVKTQVQKAIDDGLSLEQTVQRVKLAEFEGYALFNWVHPILNVSAAYKDLSTKE